MRGPGTEGLTRPFLSLYVAWHPAFEQGPELARELYEYYRRKLYDNVAGGTGIPVIYRSEPAPGSSVPIDIDLDGSETTAIILLVDKHWTSSDAWIAWAKQLSKRTDDAGFTARIFPVAIDDTALKMELEEQAILWNAANSQTSLAQYRDLKIKLSYQFCRMLRSYLEHLERPALSEIDLLKYLRPVDIFLSHSKHDSNGSAIALLVQDFLKNASFSGFFDVFDIPAGLRFNKVILQKVRVSAFVAIHTDSYSSREWCRREIIEAKRYNVPLVVANCLDDVDERGFPYMANVPIVRMDPKLRDRIDVVVCRLMDEVLKDFLWQAWTRIVGKVADSRTAFIPRPPELIVLATLKQRMPDAHTLVYPDPPIGAEEIELFATAAPSVRLLSVTQWLAGLTT